MFSTKVLITKILISIIFFYENWQILTYGVFAVDQEGKNFTTSYNDKFKMLS